MSKEKILIGVPYFDKVEEQCEESIQVLIKTLSDRFHFEYTKVKSGVPCSTRNQLLKSVKDHDYFLGVDADTAFTPGDFLSLYDRKKQIVFGAYPTKTGSGFEAGGFNPKYKGCIDVKLPLNETGLIKVDWAGTGFFLIQSFLIKNIGSPWFTCPEVDTPDGKDVASEDIAFCMKLAEHKVDIYVDCDVKLKHLIREDEIELLRKKGWRRLLIPESEIVKIISAIKKLPYEDAEPILTGISRQMK